MFTDICSRGGPLYHWCIVADGRGKVAIAFIAL